MKLPVVAIVGRPNVGKSAFFNAVVGSRISIVDEVAGVTRDRVSTEVEFSGRLFELIDTGGIGLFDEALLKDEVQHQIDIAIESADGIIFMVDIREGIVPLDQEVARLLRVMNKPLILVANKADTLALSHGRHQFHKLGFGDPIAASALERRSVFEAIDRILELIPAPPQEEEIDIGIPKIAIVGKRNAGKSTLVNLLAQENRVIVSELPGTTRDSVDVRIAFDGNEYMVIDTAGLRKKRSLQDSIEFYGQTRTARAIRRADMVLFLVDATQDISIVDKQIAKAVLESYKPCIICLTKWDLTREKNLKTDDYGEYVSSRLSSIRFAPLSIMSPKTGFHVKETFRLIPDLLEQASMRASTAMVNKVLAEAITRRAPRTKKSRVAKIYFGSQVEVNPPTLIVFVNDSRLFNDEYKRYLAGRFREFMPYHEVPLKFIFRGKEHLTEKK